MSKQGFPNRRRSSRYGMLCQTGLPPSRQQESPPGHGPNAVAAPEESDTLLEYGRPTKRQYSQNIISRKDHMLGAGCFALEAPEFDEKLNGGGPGTPPGVPTKLERDKMVGTPINPKET